MTFHLDNLLIYKKIVFSQNEIKKKNNFFNSRHSTNKCLTKKTAAVIIECFIHTSSSGTPKFLKTARALLSLSFLRSASVPITVLGLLLGDMLGLLPLVSYIPMDLYEADEN